jgi:hypothetical protein
MYLVVVPFGAEIKYIKIKVVRIMSDTERLFKLFEEGRITRAELEELLNK